MKKIKKIKNKILGAIVLLTLILTACGDSNVTTITDGAGNFYRIAVDLTIYNENNFDYKVHGFHGNFDQNYFIQSVPNWMNAGYKRSDKVAFDTWDIDKDGIPDTTMLLITPGSPYSEK
ncbi:MAG: hypothetical protein ACTSXL_03750 [Alphaproteobacteria bacterium]